MLKFRTPYICPSISTYSKFDELLNSRKDAKFSWMFREKKDRTKEGIVKKIFDRQKNLILSEPGYGKTRLLLEIKENLIKSGHKVVFSELKYFTHEKSLEAFTIEQARLQGISLDSLTDDLVLCYDALDEVRQDSFFELVRQLKLFFEKYKNIKIILSCRLLFYQKYPVFESDNFSYVFIDNFDFDDVRQYLASVLIENGARVFSDAEIDSIVYDFKEPNWESIILIPRYVEKFVEFRQSNPGLKPTRSSLYDFFVNERLEIEDSKRGAQDGVIIRRVLEKIALVMEIYQKNEISKDELLTIMEDIGSYMAGNFLDMGKLKILFEHSLWKDEGNAISFEDHTLQEYLASCELLRLGGQRFLYDFVVDRLLNEIHPSWFGTLSFCIDQDINLLEPLIDFGQRGSERVIESDEYHRFLAKVDVSKLSFEQKIRIFKKVFGQYQKERIWIDWEIARRLAMFFEPSLDDYLKGWIENGSPNKSPEMARYIPRGNVAQVLGFILRQNLLDEGRNTFWKEKLIEFANDDNENGVLQRNALFALEAFKDETIIPKVQKSFSHPSDSVRDRFIDFCSEVDPNSQLSVKFFIEGVKQDSIHANMALVKINNKDSLKFLLENLNSDSQFLKTILEHERIYFKDDKNIFKNVDDNYDDDIQKLLVDIIFKSISLLKYDSLLINNAASVLIKHKPDIILDICDVILGNDEYKKHLFNFDSLFSLLLRKDTIKKVVDKLSAVSNSGYNIFYGLQWAKTRNDPGANEAYEEGRAYLQDIYRQVETEIAKRTQALSQAEVAYKELLVKLEPEPGKYRNDVFQYFAQKYDTLKPLLRTDDLSRLEKLTRDLLTRINPQKAELKILQWDEKHKNIVQFQLSSTVFVFGDCLKVAKILGLKIDDEIRKNVIDFIPFAEQEELECIMALIPDIKASELKDVLNLYKSDSEKKYFRPYNFIKIVKDHKLLSAVPVLKSFVADENFPDYDRGEALKCIGELESDSKYFQDVFTCNLGKNNRLAEAANQILIEKFCQKEAVQWRIEEIKKRQFKFTEAKGAHFVGNAEAELHEKVFAGPLMKLTSKEFMPDYISLLASSFDLLEKDKEYWSYVQYIWEVVTGYMDSLKLNGDYAPIKELEDFVLKSAEREGVNWFSKRLKELKRSYQVYIGVPKTVTDCIKLYNNIKSRQYLEIGSVRELKDKIKEVIDKDIRFWVEVQGIKELICGSGRDTASETKIQKIMFIPLKAGLERLGIIVLREPQKFDDERVDYLISYGFSPNMIIVIEVKKSKHKDMGLNSDLSKKESFQKLERYIKGFSAQYGIFLVFNVHYNIQKWKILLKNVEKYYSKIEHVEVMGIDAFN